MKNKKCFLVFCLISILFLTFFSCLLAQSPAHVILFHASDSPVEITQFTPVDTNFTYHFIIHNKSNQDIENIYLLVFLFSSDNENQLAPQEKLVDTAKPGSSPATFRKGGISFFINKKLNALKSEEVTVNLKGIVDPEKPTAPDMINDLFASSSAIILIPVRVDYKPERNSKEMISKSWFIEFTSLAGIKPNVIASYNKIQGKTSDTPTSIDEKSVCPFCSWVRDYYYVCGTAQGQNRCRKFACIHSNLCECTTQYCAFMCKSADQCCI